MTSFCHQWEDRNIKKGRQFVKTIMEGFRLLGLYLYKFIGTNEAVYITKEFNSNRIGLEHQHGSRFIVLEHQYGRPDVMWKRSISCYIHAIPVVYWLCGEFQPGRIAQISRKSDSAFHLRKSSSVHSQEFPLESLFMAFVYMNVPPVFKTCKGEVDLGGNGKIPQSKTDRRWI